MRKAFTLIELLVVIAIIAILAAILFPVFAQAKAAAKGAASISNAKQHVLAAIMYASDNEDYLPIALAWRTGNDTISFGALGTVSPWGWSVQPYMKSDGLFRDPLATPNTLPTGFSRIVYDTLIPHYGYNYTFMSPYIVDPANALNLLATSTSTTTPASPTATVMMASKFTAQEERSGCCWLWSPTGAGSGGWNSETTIDGPNCNEVDEFCSRNWGTTNGFWDSATGANLPTNESGRRTGGMSSRATSKAVIGWVDGHANKLAPTALGAGTNYSNTRTAATLVFTNRSNYVWDLQ